MPLASTYRPRHPEHTAFYQCLEDYWEEFKEAYPYFYEKDYGPWRPARTTGLDGVLLGAVEREAHSLGFTLQDAVHKELCLGTDVEGAYGPGLQASEPTIPCLPEPDPLRRWVKPRRQLRWFRQPS